MRLEWRKSFRTSWTLAKAASPCGIGMIVANSEVFVGGRKSTMDDVVTSGSAEDLNGVAAGGEEGGGIKRKCSHA